MLDRTFNAKSAVDFVERARNKDNARVANRAQKSGSYAMARVRKGGTDCILVAAR